MDSVAGKDGPGREMMQNSLAIRTKRSIKSEGQDTTNWKTVCPETLKQKIWAPS